MGNAKPLVGVFLVLGLILAGAVFFVLRGGRETRYLAPSPEEGRLSPSLFVDVYVDGSGSMQNLLAGRGENYLHNLLIHLDSVLNNPPVRNGWSPITPSYQKFGARLTPLHDVGALSHLANTPKDFNEPKTPIEVPARDNPHPGSNALKIIITDLYQSDQANEKPAIAITDRYLSKASGAVAVLGIRNPYVGPVEDLPGLHGRSLANAADSMPFYVIIAGENASDVRRMERLLLDETGIQGAFRADRGFTAFFSKDPGDFTEQSPALNWMPHGPHKDRAVGRVDPSGQPHIDSLTLHSGTVQVRWPLTAQDVGASQAPIGSQLSLRSTALVSNRPREVKAETTGTEKAAEACDTPPAVCVAIDRNRLKHDRPYLFRFDVVADAPSDQFGQDSALMKQWNIEPGDVEKISLTGDHKFPPQAHVPGAHPGMTPDLAQFLGALQGQTFHQKNGDTDLVRTATYYLYVKGE